MRKINYPKYIGLRISEELPKKVKEVKKFYKGADSSDIYREALEIGLNNMLEHGKR